MTHDKLFKEQATPSDFTFDDKAAAVFDDMLDRSIPLYSEIQRMVTELGAKFLHDGGTVYDVGCSTGNTILKFNDALPADHTVKYVGIEPSAAMRDKCAEKLAAIYEEKSVELWAEPIEQFDRLPGARVIVMLYTLQFIRPLNRNAVLRMCYESLEPGGCLLLGEKVLSDSSTLSRLYIELYHEYKRRNGYSATEMGAALLK